MHDAAVRLLGSTNNARGDLFARLAKDLFFALGYDDLRLNVHKSGRELDLEGVHRFEPRRVVAEFKAHDEPMGGRDLNTFLGVLTRERDKNRPTPISGYFVSLSGFRETGVEQELETSADTRIILLDGPKVVAELERAKLLVSREEAVERAGRGAHHAGVSGAVLDRVELLGHDLGYVWAVTYSQGKQPTHVALVHADGTLLAQSIAREVLASDRKMRGTLDKLAYLAPPPPAADRVTVGAKVVDQYSKWLEQECGYIQLDGLPADTDLSATRMKLEKLFVPLKVSVPVAKPSGEPAERITSVGEFLTEDPHIALVAKPGGGKSTLLKRLAIAYAIPGRRTQLDDHLPDRKWLPLFLRCRELRDRVQRPILDLLDDLPRYAGLSEDEAAVFGDRVHEALRSGEALLLVDGLDEIAEEGSRQTFAQHLRTFVGMFPNAALVVTSREAGFRLVAGVVASVCSYARLTPFDEEDVRLLCEAWHLEVVGDTERVRADARELATTIWENERVRALAENPLMLTTLLVVRRSIGELPTRRVELYREAVRVLIRTWNTEGFTPMDLEEALAQLSYVACSMMEAGQQQIGYKPLLKLLNQARRELSAELQFTKISAAEFIERIEYRSSLLMQTGHAVVDDELQPVYEFRHLTFQEYLAARGFVEEQYPGRDEGHSLTENLEPHFAQEEWREVIPLAAVLAGRRAEAMIRRLIEICENLSALDRSGSNVTHPCVVVLRRCLLDEVQLTRATLDGALLQMARFGNEDHARGSVLSLSRGKFGTLFQELAENAFLSVLTTWEDVYRSVVDLAVAAYFPERRLRFTESEIAALLDGLRSSTRKERCRAAIACSWFCYEHGTWGQKHLRRNDAFHEMRDLIGDMLLLDDQPLAMCATAALLYMGASRLPDTPPHPDLIAALHRMWRESQSRELQGWAAGAFSTQPLLANSDIPALFSGQANSRPAVWSVKNALLVEKWYRRQPYTQEELELLKNVKNPEPFYSTARDILTAVVAGKTTPKQKRRAASGSPSKKKRPKP